MCVGTTRRTLGETNVVTRRTSVKECRRDECPVDQCVLRGGKVRVPVGVRNDRGMGRNKKNYE